MRIHIGKIKIFTLISFFIFSANIFADEEKDRTLYMERVDRICAAAGDEGYGAVTSRNKGKSLNSALQKISEVYKDNQFMKEYATNIWKGVYADEENFTAEKTEYLVVDACVRTFVKRGAEYNKDSVLTFSCKNIATAKKSLAQQRDKGFSKSKLRATFIQASKKDNTVLKALGNLGESLKDILSAVDYVYDNPKMSVDEIYRKSYIRCVAENS
jgi:hypothetical protein